MTKIDAVRLGKEKGNVLYIDISQDDREVDLRTFSEGKPLGEWLLSLGPKGVCRASGVSPDLGFPLDADGRIVLDECLDTAPDGR